MQCVREGLAPDMDVYDAATWSAPGPLSEESVRSGGSAVGIYQGGAGVVTVTRVTISVGTAGKGGVGVGGTGEAGIAAPRIP